MKALSVKQTELAVVKFSLEKSARRFFKKFRIASFIFLTLSATTSAAPSVLSNSENEDVNRVEKYLNKLLTLKSRFLQATSTGEFTEGTFYLSRPGKMRIEYDPPRKFVVVADGTWLIYHDIELDQVTHLPLRMTTANILLKKKITLRGDDIEVSKVERAPGLIGITVVPRDEDTGQLTLVFSDKPIKLKKWIVIDPQGTTTSVSLLSTQRDISLDEKLFEVKLKEAEDFYEY